MVSRLQHSDSAVTHVIQSSPSTRAVTINGSYVFKSPNATPSPDIQDVIPQCMYLIFPECSSQSINAILEIHSSLRAFSFAKLMVSGTRSCQSPATAASC